MKRKEDKHKPGPRGRKKAARKPAGAQRASSATLPAGAGVRRFESDEADPSNLRFTDNHQWVRVKGRTIIVGFTEFAQQKFSDIISVELPEPDEHHYDSREEIGVIEAVNTSGSFHAPVAGTVVATNTDLLSNPELINTDPFGDGWLVEMAPDNMADVIDLMDVDEYEGSLPEEEEE